MKFRIRFFSYLRSSCVHLRFSFFFFSPAARKSKNEVVPSTPAVDQPIADPIVRDFRKKTYRHQSPFSSTDTEKPRKSVAALAERFAPPKKESPARPGRVWWGNEAVQHDQIFAQEKFAPAIRFPPRA